MTRAVGTTASEEGAGSMRLAFILAMADLDADLDGATVARVSDNELNVSLRYVKQYSAQSDQKMARIDALYGFKEFRPDWACRVWG